MIVPKYLFVDDATGSAGDADHYRKMLSKAGVLDVELVRPDRDMLLVPETSLSGIDGYILDINLSDQADEDGVRFLGTGAGLAQDLRLFQALGPDNGGQRPRPIVRLCAAQVFQAYLEGDDSTVDIFDLGFSKESIGDHADTARAKLAALPTLYRDVEKAALGGASARTLLGLSESQYAAIHSKFRGQLEVELDRKTHEAASFLLRELLIAPGLLIDEDLLAVRLGIDVQKSPGWPVVRQRFDEAKYTGTANAAFPRWWNPMLSGLWAEIHTEPLFRLTASQRAGVLAAAGFSDIVALSADQRSPGEQIWTIARSSDPELRLPADPRFAFPLNIPVSPWLDEHVWCLEMAKRNRNSSKLTNDSLARLRAVLIQGGQRGGE